MPLLASLCLPARALSDPIETVYTSLNSKDCAEVKPPSGEEASEMVCAGVAGYRLNIHFGEGREGLTVVDPSGRNHPLDFTRLIASGFSALGLKAEWRMARKESQRVPIALIVRFWYETESGKEVSSLAVSKITPDRICLVEVIRPVSGQNVKARNSADQAGAARCME